MDTVLTCALKHVAAAVNVLMFEFVFDKMHFGRDVNNFMFETLSSQDDRGISVDIASYLIIKTYDLTVGG